MACVASRPQAGYGVCLRVLNEVCLCVCFCWYIFICKLCVSLVPRLSKH